MRLLVIGKLDGHIIEASKYAKQQGAKVAQVDDVDGAMRALRAGQGSDLIMIDAKLPVGILCKSLEQERFAIEVVACGIDSPPEEAAAAIRQGAKEYIPLPPDPELIAAVLAAVAEESCAFIHKDPKVAELLRLAERIAPSDASVLISGESGTGKEVLARYVHAHSKRSSQPLITLNCAAIPENLLESELFGHEKGSFTGAIARRIGKFEEANGGTLLLDEVTEMQPHLQAKLLRALQEKEIDRVGGKNPISVDNRVIATTNRDIEEAVREKEFREDLYFRLNVVNLRIPSLQERKGDIAPLARHFLEKYAKANDVSLPDLSPVCEEILLSYSWEGNVRELENTMHRAVILSQGAPLEPEHIHLRKESTRKAKEGMSLVEEETRSFVGKTVAEVEQDLIVSTLRHCLGNRTHAANILGISIRTLRNKLKAYTESGEQVPAYRTSE